MKYLIILIILWPVVGWGNSNRLLIGEPSLFEVEDYPITVTCKDDVVMILTEKGMASLTRDQFLLLGAFAALHFATNDKRCREVVRYVGMKPLKMLMEVSP